jgi:hypothetical protein
MIRTPCAKFGHGSVISAPLYDLLGPAKAVHRGGIVASPLAYGGTDRRYRLSFIGSAPHPAADCPGAQADPRGLQPVVPI